jgi:hypothetical protein
LAQYFERLDATLSAHKIEGSAIGTVLSNDSDRPLEAKLGNAPHNPIEDPAVSLARIDDGDPVDRHKLNLRNGLAPFHMTSVR